MTDREPPSGIWNLDSLVTGAQPPAPSSSVPPASPAPAPAPSVPPPAAAPSSGAAPSSRAAPPPLIPAPSTPAGGRNRRVMIVVGSAAAVLVAAVVTAVSVQAATRDDPAPDPGPTLVVPAEPTVDVTTEAAETPTDSPTDSPTEEATGDPDPEAEALAQLAAQHQADVATVSFGGQYAAQLASKVPGISDPYQEAADGSHVFRASDIWAEHQRLREETTDGTPIVLLRSTDYGKRQKYGGKALWVTFALGDFAGRQDVLDWCARRFPEMSGEALGNQCAVRKLEPGR